MPTLTGSLLNTIYAIKFRIGTMAGMCRGSDDSRSCSQLSDKVSDALLLRVGEANIEMLRERFHHLATALDISGFIDGLSPMSMRLGNAR